MKLAIVNDSHFGCRSNSDVFANYQETFFKEVFFPYIDKHKIKTVLDLGDTFDNRKEINFKTLTRARKMFFDELASRNIQVHTLVGNHTTYYKNTNDLSFLNTIADLYPNVKVYDRPETIQLGKNKFLMLPWICSSNYEESIKSLKESPAICVLSHLELAGFNYQAGNVSTHGMSKSLFDNFQLVLSGHYHSKSDDGRIFYLGTQYDITWADYGEKKYFHVLDSDTLDLKAIENPDKMFIKLYYDDTIKGFSKTVDSEDFSRLKGKIVKVVIVNKINAILFDRFIDKIQLSVPSELSIVDDTQRLLYNQNSENILVSSTIDIIRQTIDDITTDLNKDRLFKLMNELYVASLDD